VPAINAKLEQVHKLLIDAQRRTNIVDLDVVEAEIGFVQDQLRANLPESWLKDRNADFAILKPLLQQMQILAEASDYQNLEKLRLEAYGIFDLGPELRLMAFDRNLVAQIDGLFWQGIAGKEGLADQIKAQKNPNELKQTLGEIKVALALAERKLGGNVTPLVAIINSAIVVFREGIEAILIIFALLGSLALSESTKVYRRPLIIGVAIGVLVSILTWFLAQTILLSFLSLGEKLEAIVSLIAIAVLLLITNWFFHNTYWNRWNANLHQHKQNLLSQTEAANSKSIWQKYSVALGFCLLGLSSVYREGFETVLFLQVWVLDSGLATVAKGVLYGSVALTLVAILTFYLQKRLPYMRMLVLTGFMIVAILITMVGQTVHTLQAVGWMSITPIGEITLPYWVGLWFGLFATVETIVAQILALVVVGGSYFGAEYLRQRKSGRPGRSLWHKLVS
jgi:high-affinity iron transporter